jgi:hypothetical protein
MRDSDLFLVLIVGGLLAYWFFGVRATVAIVEGEVTQKRVTPELAPSSSRDAFGPAELGWLDFLSRASPPAATSSLMIY